MRSLTVVVLWNCVLIASAQRGMANCPDPAIPCDARFPGDLDQDGDVDRDDYSSFNGCISGPSGGPLSPDCQASDLTGDDDNDLEDMAAFQRRFTGGCDCPPLIQEPPNGQPGNPMRTVYLFSGEFQERLVDLRIKGRGFDFTWARKYRSRIGPDTEMGNGWDYSYNLHIEQAGDHIRLFDGNTRADVYRLQPDGTWVRPEFFRLLEKNIDNTYTLTLVDKLRWNFNALDGSAAEGKIASVVDRNGNTLSFDYDALGRLATIHDPLDTAAHNRDITVSYNADGFIESLTDFTGREVRYEYYDDAESGGNFGDLKSVTSPVVVGTPNGNDFPSGKATVYTYSTGSADDRLNHNLLTITDPRDQTFLVNTYATTTNPSDVDFDHLVTQIWGDPGDRVEAVYVPQTPTASNGFAVTMAVVNDRVGNVEELFYDAFHRCVLRREFTGRAPNPDAPTTGVTNRPTGKLRPTDPDYFETLYEWNADSLVARVVYPNQNETQYVYDETNLSARSRGNLIQTMRLPGPLGGDQVEIVNLFEYDPIANFGHNFVTRHVDGRGNETLHEYETEGNRTHTQHRIPSIVEDFEYNQFGQMTAHVLPDNGSSHRRRDEYAYYAAGPQRGYLQDTIVDVSGDGFAITTMYEYDPVGNLTRLIDPRDHDTQYVVNQLNQVVRSLSREVSDSTGVRYQRDTFYDANDNVVRVDIENLDETGNVPVNENTHFTTIYEYEILNFRTRACHEVGNLNPASTVLDCSPTTMPFSDSIHTAYEFDANRNRTLVRHGEATNDNQPDNVVRTFYDERDLLFQTVRAPSVKGPGGQSTDQADYDGDRNVVRTLRGIEDAPRITSNTYDGYDRLVSTTDPMGNVTIYHYDRNNNLGGFQDAAETVRNPFAVRIEGELDDVEGSDGNVRLTESWTQYDDMDRVIRTEVEFFDPDAQTPLPGGQQLGKAITTTEYNDNSQVTRRINDNLHDRTTTYDTANRRRTVTDAKGNTVTSAYDANSNVTSRTEVEKPDVGVGDETFVTSYTYDNLDRLIQTVDNVGNTNVYAFDSRDNRTLLTDALNNETRYMYDGINRLTSTIRDMDDDGADGDGTDITTARAWDDSSRLIARTDDNANTTFYTYDALDRRTAKTYADGTLENKIYDVHGNVISSTDANFTLHTNTHDKNNRLTNKTVDPGPGVSNDTTSESYKYDGLSRLVMARDDDSVVLRKYDSLSRVTREDLTIQAFLPDQTIGITTMQYDGVGNMLQCVYPGGRTITTTYDELERTELITVDGGSKTIATYDYVGPGRVERREYGNGTRTGYTYGGITGIPNPDGDFGVKRIIGTRHTVIGPVCAVGDCPSGATCDGGTGKCLIDDRTYTWDKMSNKTQRKDVRSGRPQLTHNYSYDDIYRLTHTTVTDATAKVVRDTHYHLDGVGNRTVVTGSPDLGPHVGDYTMIPTLPEPADFQMNQYTTTAVDAREYDLNGNLTTIDGALPINVKYDYRNQMVEYNPDITDERHTYAYDALGRRISKVVDVDGGAGGPNETRYFYHGLRVIEEQDGAAATQATYVYGLYIDEVLNMQRTTGMSHCDNNPKVACTIAAECKPDGLCLPDPLIDYYYHTDDLYNVMALTDAAGVVVERYEYADYGQPINPNKPASIVGDPSAIGNPYLFTGRRYDPETAWYYYRSRYLDPVAGRFVARQAYRQEYLCTLGNMMDLAARITFINSAKGELRGELRRPRRRQSSFAVHGKPLADIFRRFSSGVHELDPPLSNYQESLQVIMKESVTENNESKRYMLGRLANLNRISRSLKVYLEQLEESVKVVGDDAQLGNIHLQESLQKMQQILQMMSNLFKMLHDTQMAIIREMKGGGDLVVELGISDGVLLTYLGLEDRLTATEIAMQEMNQSFSLHYLQFQQDMQQNTREFMLLSNVLKSKHKAAKNAVNNIR